ncbi:hypothetical protein CYY_002753 [Polysphondylium violaceum]|uniref:ATP synthase mitochondrial F1 complex assembly factor 2 n=1 Tax=Polysphondylium violaceum TaxID=133409 RepID=A0A8J4PYU6_9MYCE|nr:hypothetical protein CYY_002753 [Polysphondylium violaceum]
MNYTTKSLKRVCNSFWNNRYITSTTTRSLLKSNINTSLARSYTTTASSSTSSSSSNNTTKSFEEIQKQRADNEKKAKFLRGEVMLEGIRNDGTSLRWYKDTGYAYSEEHKGWLPLIDNRPIKTPMGNVIVLPAKEIAMAIAAEWINQGKYILPSRLPITQTIISCLDIFPEGRKKMIGEFITHLSSDPVAYRDDEDMELKALQDQYFNPIIEWGSKYYGVPFFISTGLKVSDHPPKLLKAIEKHLNLLSNMELVCLQLIAQSSKSFLITLALYYGQIKLDSLYKMVAMEEDLQSQTWGKIPFGHDLDECETHNEIAPPLFILRSMKPIPNPPKVNIH